MMEIAWKKYNQKKKKEVFAFAENYRKFISDCKTERECVIEGIRIAEEHGFRNIEDCIRNGEKLVPGDKVYLNNKGKDLALFIIGKKPISEGMNILGAHIDSPRIDWKQHPFYEDHDIALADTHYYGGIKSYQWVTLPLAIHGIVCRKDGSSVNIVIGEKPTDPVVGISDLLIHLSRDQMQKTANKVIEGEDLNVTIGSIPLEKTEKEAVKANILKLLKKKYDIEEDDFISAEIEIVPAGPARNYGLDESMIMGYGHDDRVCAYTSLMAMMEIENPEKTVSCMLVDKEEVGSIGSTGMQSYFYENIVAELVELTEGYDYLKFRRCLANSKMLSSDVSAAYDPNYPSVNEMKNTAFFGYGIVMNKYVGSGGKSGSNDANPEFIAEIRKVWDDAEVSWQTAELGRVNRGGGGTIAYIMAKYNMQVIDSGVAVQNMHAPWEVVSKADVFEAKNAYVAFCKNI
ncbi:MAG: aminopeptidase [Erysipelotrichaceae bacterium]|nr:aminopeptidase [Erysipelotrichaceae bacterium]